MSASIPIPFPLGESLWWTGYGSREEWVTCEECQGTCASVVVLANGETYSLACEACVSGYDPPRGIVKKTVRDFRPQTFIPKRVEVRGDEISYGAGPPNESCLSPVEASKLFSSLEECVEACVKLNEQSAIEEEKWRLNNLKHKKRDLAFSVHYWRGQAKRHRKDLEYAEARLHVCIEREKRAKEAIDSKREKKIEAHGLAAGADDGK